MVRVITQETYDEVVQENIDEFEMTPEEAIKEAVAQFEAQGVDLSNIIKDLALSSGDDHAVSTSAQKLKEYCLLENYDTELVLKELETLKNECSKDIAHRVRAGNEGVYKSLTYLWDSKWKVYEHDHNEKVGQFLTAVMDTMVALMDGQPDLLDIKGVGIIKSVLVSKTNEELLISTLKWTSVCCLKHEMNRQNIFNNIKDDLKAILEQTSNKQVISECLSVVRKLTLDDDIRHEFGKAHDHARELGINLLDTLGDLLKAHPEPPLVSELLLSAACLVVRHELCARLVEGPPGVAGSAGDGGSGGERGAGGALLAALAANYDNAGVTLQAAKLITALAGNDDVKRNFVKGGIVPIIISLLNRHSNNAQTSAALLKCVAALALREAAHGQQFLDNGAPDAVLQCMKIHPDSAPVQKNACWAIRNMVARCREHNARFRELGAEALLNLSRDKFGQQFDFDIKSALRDLECDVKLDEPWKGQGVQIDK